MASEYNFSEVEKQVQDKWSEAGGFSYGKTEGKSQFFMFLIPPNASGPMHVGNALMVALQDILARYHRANGNDVLWVPGFDHGGYETQVTFEREREAAGEQFAREEWQSADLFSEIEQFVKENKSAITTQIKSLGASVDWSKARYTMDESSLKSVGDLFGQMVEDNLVARKSYMMNYCPECATVLADIELKKEEKGVTLYHIRFPYSDGSGTLSIGTNKPEFLFSMKQVLVHPHDVRFADEIGKKLINPVSGEEIEVISSKRKVNLHQDLSYISDFVPSFDRFDYEYAMRNNLSTENLLDWSGRLTERNPGLLPEEAREKEVEFLREVGAIEFEEKLEEGERVSRCKKGHKVSNIIRETWFLDVDGEESIRQKALEALEQEKLNIYPSWRKKGLVDWITKMHNWPIARQNVWGIRIPVWYEVTNPEDFLVWFFDKEGVRQHGNLQSFLEEGVTYEEITSGLQRVYAPEGCVWVTEPEEGRTYLPETDTFDTWFSSGAWSTIVYENLDVVNFDDCYPSSTTVVGHDLLRLSIARKVMLGVYQTGKLPFKRVYFHPLLLCGDGQKMSKSIGNVTTLESYLEKYGADVTRMALVSYTGQADDFVFDDKRLETFKGFVGKLKHLSRAYEALAKHGIDSGGNINLKKSRILSKVERLRSNLSKDIENHFFSRAQESVVNSLSDLLNCLQYVYDKEDMTVAKEFMKAWEEYLVLLHPFAPHVTEYLSVVTDKEEMLALKHWTGK